MDRYGCVPLVNIFYAATQESHQILVSGLKLLWPNLPLQSEENDMPMIGIKPASCVNPDVMSMALRDEVVALGM